MQRSSFSASLIFCSSCRACSELSQTIKVFKNRVSFWRSVICAGLQKGHLSVCCARSLEVRQRWVSSCELVGSESESLYLCAAGLIKTSLTRCRSRDLMPYFGSNTLRQCGMAVAQDSLRGFPAEAGIGNGNSVAQVGRLLRKRLAAFMQIAFQHCPNQDTIPCHALLDHAAPDILLSRMLFTGIGMTAIHHQHRGQTGLSQLSLGLAQAVEIVISAEPSAAQDHVADGIPGCANDARRSVLVNPEKAVRCACRAHGIEGNLQPAIGAVLK